ncbi:hypothetical protein CEXT_224271 [Caerostris extrusa]|uniref:Uncharacterized protein n=1 Tax=Caerostris extrusa TaxID=172846 RepID=A0AAV4XHD8_CAEEX|nr:hypothetical protein CEXT_224271 [Caerostris extrusa]
MASEKQPKQLITSTLSYKETTLSDPPLQRSPATPAGRPAVDYRISPARLTTTSANNVMSSIHRIITTQGREAIVNTYFIEILLEVIMALQQKKTPIHHGKYFGGPSIFRGLRGDFGRPSIIILWRRLPSSM